MSRQHRVHTRTGVELVRKLGAEGDRIFTVKRARELAPAAGLSDDYLRQALHYLTGKDLRLAIVLNFGSSSLQFTRVIK